MIGQRLIVTVVISKLHKPFKQHKNSSSEFTRRYMAYLTEQGAFLSTYVKSKLIILTIALC